MKNENLNLVLTVVLKHINFNSSITPLKKTIMKKQTLLSVFGLLMIFNFQYSHAQGTTITIDLSNSVTGMERSGAPTIPAPAVPDFAAYSWTCGGSPCIGRTLMSVDLSAIPSNATILYATLSVYADPQCTYLGYFGQPTYGTQNRGVIKRITSPWDPNTVTWNNQPSISNANKLELISSSTLTQDYLNLDATALVQDMIDNPSYGILLKMSDETNYYKSLILGSNSNAVSTYKPTLVVTYSTEGVQKPNTSLIAPWQVTISPNPASQDIMFGFSDVNDGEMIQLSLYSITGRVLRSEVIPASSAHTMNVADLDAGVYFYKAENNTTHATYSGKFFKQ